MKFSRVIIITWAIGTLILFGLWGGSMFYSYGFFRYGAGQHESSYILAVYSGSLHFSEDSIQDPFQDPFMPISIEWFADEYEAAKIDDPFAATATIKHPPEAFGRYYFRVDVHNDSFEFSLPIWVLSILWTVLAFSIHLLLSRRLSRWTTKGEQAAPSNR